MSMVPEVCHAVGVGQVTCVELSDPEGVRWTPSGRTGDGVLVVSGSSGRIEDDRARILAEQGCIAESIRWFGGPGQHRQPWEIAIETFTDRVNRLSDLCDRVYVVGTSFGSEAVLLCGALSDQVSGVVAISPSDVVWAGYDDGRETSHWTHHAEPLPWMRFDWSGQADETPPRYLPMYERSRETFADLLPAATIPVERIRTLILVAGGDDQVWPSRLHAERITALRAAAGLPTTLITDDEAGHRVILPGEPVVAGGVGMHRGGTESADRRLGRRAWEAIVAMLVAGRTAG